MNKTKQFKIETPIATVESDSGNHFVDVITVMFAVGFLYVTYIALSAWIKGIFKRGNKWLQK